ncbi:hypothetical protein [Streptomyces sp. NPDC005805]|uniref:hypothetical protein n=1 Tax=Streptomyces sp. NPDC005805 TaxID=3157068 RepID=UPI0033CC9C6E
MLTYQDAVTVNLATLTTAAKHWDETADGFDELQEAYDRSVLRVATGGEWVGASAGSAKGQFTATSKQFAAGQTEARAIASILRDAHEQFARLIGEVKELVEQAKKAGFAVDAQGRAHYDFEELAKYRNDPDYDDIVTKAKAAEGRWTRSIAAAVRAVDDADQGVKLALHDAAGVKGFFERVFDFDSVFGGPGFNGEAVGDIEVVEAREAKKYADQILAGEKPADLAEYERLMRDNAHDEAFSRTLLNSLGAEDTLKLSNKVNDLAYFDDTKDKRSYLNINSGLATSLATATKVPDFYGPRNAEGNRPKLDYGSAEYKKQFEDWKKTPDGRYYTHWVDEFHKYGDDKYDLKVAGEKIQIGHGSNQEVRGYQSLATLMQQGEGFSAPFVADVTDNMIAMEKKDPDIWDLRGEFSGKKDGWFANDPVDGALDVMSRDPAGAAAYLDPGTTEGKERYHYLLGQGDGSRDWDIVDTREYRKVETSGPDQEDADTRAGLGAALTAAATGVDPAGGQPRPTGHSEANNRIFEYSLEYLSKQGDDMHSSLRDDMAKILVNHGDEVHESMGKISGQSSDNSLLNQGQLMEITKQVSRSQESYGILHEGMNYAMLQDFNDAGRAPEDTLRSAGHTVGFMEEARYNALKGDLKDYTWEKAWSYHASGAALNFIPVVGDIAQRGADVVTTAWIMDEQKQQSEKLTGDSQATYQTRQRQLDELARQWYAANSDWARENPGFSLEQGVYDQIAAAANDGNKHADGLSGDQ